MPPHAGTPTSTTTLPSTYQSVLLSISGDSKISLQHTSVQQLGTIPEGRELVDKSPGNHQEDQVSLSPTTVTGGPPILIDDDQFDEPHVLIQDPAPDGGYGWVIVLASFLCNLIVDGIAYTFGLFLDIFVLHFGTSKSKVALCGALLNGCYLGAGPIISSLANRYGCRFVTILGSILACIALIISTAAPNIETLMVTYGVFGGIGFGMIYLPAIVSVGYYFTSKRAFATGVAVCGSGLGTFIFAPFCQYLLSVTTWQNTLFILALLVLMCAAFGSLMRPLNIHAEAVLAEEDEDQVENCELRKPLLQRIAEEKRRRLLAHSNSQFLLMMQNGSIDMNDPTFNELKARLTMNTEPGVHSTLYLDQLFAQSPFPTTPSPTPTPSIYYPSASVNQSLMTLEKHQLSPIMEKKVVSIENLSDDNSAETLNQLTVTTVVEVDHHQRLQDVFNKLDAEELEETTIEGEENETKKEDDKKLKCLPLLAIPQVKANSRMQKMVKNLIVLHCIRLLLAMIHQGDDISSISPSSVTLPQSPTHEEGQSNANFQSVNQAVSASLLGSNNSTQFRSRRSTMRSQNSGSDSLSLLNPSSAALMHNQPSASPTNLGSTQIPVQVILSTPNHQSKEINDSKDSKDNTMNKRINSKQTIHVRPMYKKDIFYSGSTQYIPHSQLSLSHQCQSGVSVVGQSMVSIPARDIIDKVQKQIAAREQEMAEAEEAATNGGVVGSPRNGIQLRHRNFCNKIVKIICPFKNDLDCYKKGDKESNCDEAKQLQLTTASHIKDETGNDIDETDSNNIERIAHDQIKPKQSIMAKLRSKIPPSMRTILNEMLDLSLLRDSSAFTILAISNVFGMMGFYVPFVYIAQFASSSIKDGDDMVSKESAALLISVIGITNTFGRLLFGFISDRIARNGSFLGIPMTALGLNNFCVFISGVSVALIPFCDSYLTVMIVCIMFGLFVSAYICLTSIILVDMLGLDKLTNAFGLLCLFRGASSMIGPPLAGIIFDMTQSYMVTFVSAGILLIFASVMAFFITIREHTVDQEPENECDA
ncbi:hypothetical protein RDWZM_008547 [Blomia tropicalis]|uniref:Major facilitator superfamily (MFS) profile domain-containing protein n=1 Tax=Blomia tropicalis TaxID=40697 RepID=A0A9Q0RKF9_BLOTA|nr:hypothetical protein RDWZM_008547 [Blomia tropicalis]